MTADEALRALPEAVQADLRSILLLVPYQPDLRAQGPSQAWEASCVLFSILNGTA